MAAADQVGHRIFFRFERPVCAGESSYFVGLFSHAMPRFVSATVRQSSPAPAALLSVGARAPELPASEPFANLKGGITGLSAGSFVVMGHPDIKMIEGRKKAMINRVEEAQSIVGMSDPNMMGDPDASIARIENRCSADYADQSKHS